jgi:acetyltransferase-like isoleucine patch superfamily enzyme
VSVRDGLKASARGVALVVMLPAMVSFAIRSRLIGRPRALEGTVQWLALLPGVWGQYLRRAFLSRAIEACAPSATVCFGVLFSHPGARVDADAYVGPYSVLGWTHIGPGALLGTGVLVPSGRHTHGTADPDTPPRDQPGTLRLIRIGDGAWIGNGAVVMADVGRHAIVGAGAVVTRPIPDGVVAAGVPARVIRPRGVEDLAIAPK